MRGGIAARGAISPGLIAGTFRTRMVSGQFGSCSRWSLNVAGLHCYDDGGRLLEGYHESTRVPTSAPTTIDVSPSGPERRRSKDQWG